MVARKDPRWQKETYFDDIKKKLLLNIYELLV